MNRILLMVLWMGASTIALAEWTPAGVVGGVSLHVDLDSVTRAEGNEWQATTLINHSQAFVMFGLSYTSVVSRMAFDCQARTRRMLSYSAFSGPMGTGSVVESKSTSDEEAGTPIDQGEQALFDRVCKAVMEPATR